VEVNMLDLFSAGRIGNDFGQESLAAIDVVTPIPGTGISSRRRARADEVAHELIVLAAGRERLADRGGATYIVEHADALIEVVVEVDFPLTGASVVRQQIERIIVTSGNRAVARIGPLRQIATDVIDGVGSGEPVCGWVEW